jgi:L-ribulose-5-phosphate 4-epimerase
MMLDMNLETRFDGPSAIDRARAEVLAASKQMSRGGLVASVWGNVSARIAGTDLAVVTPSGVDYETMDAGMLGVVSIATGERVEGVLKPSSEVRMHLAIYRARADVLGVMHTHSTWASAFAAAHQGIPAVVEDLAQVVGGAVPCARYALAGTEELATSVVEALGGGSAALLANHGVVGVGRTVAEALRVCQIVEKGAQIYALASSIGGAVALPPHHVEALREAYLTAYGQRAGPPAPPPAGPAPSRVVRV